MIFQLPTDRPTLSYNPTDKTSHGCKPKYCILMDNEIPKLKTIKPITKVSTRTYINYTTTFFVILMLLENMLLSIESLAHSSRKCDELRARLCPDLCVK